MTLDPHAIRAVVDGEHGDPFAVLGPHRVQTPGGAVMAVRAIVPGAAAVRVLPADAPPTPMERLHPVGFFETVLPDRRDPFAYRLEVTRDGHITEIEDPYRFRSLLSDFDRHLLAEGTHYRAHEKLGAHPAVLDGVTGVAFAVWAPSARRVSVVGDFNDWDGRSHPMRLHPANGIWEIFVPGLGEGERYKFEIRGHSVQPLALKSDPYALAFEEETPRTASVVASLDDFRWGDEAWLAARARVHPLHEPLSIYEVHLGSWRRVPEEGDRFLDYRELADQLADYVGEMGFTHVELLPVMEHPFFGSWGYQTIGYFAPSRRYGGPREFMAFVDHLHRRGVGVILDWVPAHFPRDPHGLVYFDGTHLYYHADGIRVDAVASALYLDYSRKPGEWVPNQFGGRENLGAVAFFRRLNEVVHGTYPGVIVAAEESTSWPMVSRPTYLGGLGFGFKWNLGWMHDVLDYMSLDPVHRKYHHNQLTFGLLYAWTENFVLPLSHDEVVHGKGSLLTRMPGDDWQQFANLRALYAFMWTHPGKKLLFMGGEIGQRREWHHDRSLDWHLLGEGSYHRGLQRLVRDLNRLYGRERALHELDADPAGFAWIDCADWQQSVVSFV